MHTAFTFHARTSQLQLTLHGHLNEVVDGGRHSVERNTLIGVSAVACDVVDDEYLPVHPDLCHETGTHSHRARTNRLFQVINKE